MFKARSFLVALGTVYVWSWVCLSNVVLFSKCVVLIWTYVLDHCPTGRLNDDPVLVSWQRQPDFDLICPGISWSP